MSGAGDGWVWLGLWIDGGGLLGQGMAGVGGDCWGWSWLGIAGEGWLELAGEGDSWGMAGDGSDWGCGWLGLELAWGSCG